MVCYLPLICRILRPSMGSRREAARCGVRCIKARRCAGGVLLVLAFLASAASGQAQVVAGDDTYSVPFGENLVVEAPGVLANDTFNGDPAEDHSATAELVGDVSYGYLSCPDTELELCP